MATVHLAVGINVDTLNEDQITTTFNTNVFSFSTVAKAIGSYCL